MPLPFVLLPLLAQAGSVSPGPGPALPQAPLEIHRKSERAPRREAPPAAPAGRPSTLAAQCVVTAQDQPAAAVRLAQTWRDSAVGAGRAAPEQCLGLALTRLERFAEAETAFLAARDHTAAADPAARARRGSMAANAALAAGAADRALQELDSAHAAALDAADPQLAAEVSIDRARALVALKREADAAAALAEARSGAPQNPQAWLLSATLSRRQGRLGDAQQQIERAAQLAPLDPEIGLEAGVIAALGGHDAAARRSFESVIKAAPDGEPAIRARAYLAQLGPAAP